MNALQFPQGSDLSKLLDLDRATVGELDLDELFAKALTNPVDDFFSRPRKNVRNQLVELGFMVAARHLGLKDYDRAVLKSSCDILEIFHAGSLVVDDIEDGSLYRRGAKSLHSVYGVPLALNAGNWLYFLPFQIIEEMSVDAERKAALARECQSTLLRAHYGQALDLGVNIEGLSQDRVYGVALAAMELKAGVLMGLALSMGALVMGGGLELTQSLNRFGRKIGIALQMFDDIGNLSSSHNIDKRCEDLKLKRVGYIFGVASRVLGEPGFSELIALSNLLPESCERVLSLLAEGQVAQIASHEASFYLSGVIDTMATDLKLENQETEQMAWLKSCLVESYA
jgi:geranylgeranyl pyrophosphate synthase